MLKKLILLTAIGWRASLVFAGGSGLNVMVVVNQNSPNSVRLGNEYCEKRGVPPEHVFRMTNWNSGNIAWTKNAFETSLRDPLLAAISNAGLTNQISFILLSTDIPYRVEDGDSGNSTTSVLFYGFKTNTPVPPGLPTSCSLPDFSSNSFAFSEMPFESAQPGTAETNSFLAFMLTDNTLAGAEAILARGLAADNTFPTQTVYLEKTSDAARNVRFFSFDNAIFDSRVRGDAPLVRIDSDSQSFENIRGLLTGFATLSLSSNTFVPGALGDSLTSYAGALFDNIGQTTLLAFLDAGAAASYGTVIEPCNYLQKFPDPMAYIYQNRGFCAAEAYYQSVLNPFEGLFVGEPLSAPFAAPGQADWPGLTNDTVLIGHASLPAALFPSASANQPVGQVDLFVDGRLSRTLTNIVPASGSVLSLTLNGQSLQYTTPTNATIFSIAHGLSDLLNTQSNDTRVAAANFGDRIELQSLDVSVPGSNVLLQVDSPVDSAVSLSPSGPKFLDSIAVGYLSFTVTNATTAGDWLTLEVTKTNGSQVSLSVTNSGTTNIVDLVESLLNAVSASTELQGNDGIRSGDLYQDINIAQFLFYARSPGWAAARVKATLTASANLVVLPSGSYPFEDNISDLRPRNHLYISTGLDALSMPISLDTTQLADGFHELTLVAYEGTSVRTQTRISRSVQIRNSNLSANLLPQISGTNVTIDTPLTLIVQASSNNVLTTKLFSTGGLIGTISNQQNATFSVPTSLLGVGLHPFYAVVSDTLGHQFRTQTISLRILPSLTLAISASPLALSWSSVPGFTYDVLASTNLLNGFQKIGSVTAAGTISQWSIVPSGNPGFYQVRLTP